jgi:YVTN family beta-propeller protein
MRSIRKLSLPVILTFVLARVPAQTPVSQSPRRIPVMHAPASTQPAATPVAGTVKPMGDTWDPPPFPDDLPPWPNDPPPIFDDPFDPISDLPDPLEIPFPPEDPIDLPDPFEFPPPAIEDPFPDLPSLNEGEPIDLPDLPDFPPPPKPLSPLGLPESPRAVANVATQFMPFPMRLPFHPAYSGVAAPATIRPCDPTLATIIAIPESKSNTVYFLNTCAGTVKRVTVGAHPAAAAATPDGRLLLVSNLNAANLSVVDLTSMTTVATISLPTSFNGQPAQPTAIAITPDGTRAYVTDHDDIPGSVVYLIDIPNRKFLSTIPVGAFPASIAITPDGSQVWVPSRGDSNITVIDTMTNTPTVTIGNVTLATGIAFNPTGTRAYAAEGIETGGAVLVIDTSSYTAIASIPVGNLPHAVAVSPSGHDVFVTNALSNFISQINPNTNTVVRNINIKVGQHPLGLAFINR